MPLGECLHGGCAVPHPVSWTMRGGISVWVGRRSSILTSLCDRGFRRTMVRPPPRPFGSPSLRCESRTTGRDGACNSDGRSC